MSHVSGIAIGPLSNDSGLVALPTGGFFVYVPFGEIWEIDWFQAQVVTDVTVGNRNIDFYIDGNDGNIYHYVINDRTITASLTEDYLVSIADDPGAFDIERRIETPEVALPGQRIGIDDTDDVATGDQVQIIVKGYRYRSDTNRKVTS